MIVFNLRSSLHMLVIIYLSTINCNSTSISISTVSSVNLLDEYFEYLVTFNKDVARLYDVKRLEAFETAAHIIKTVNILNNGTFTVNHTMFSDLMPDELSNMFTFSTYNATASVGITDNSELMQQSYDLLATERSSLSWSSSNNPMRKPIVTRVRNQGLCGGCWAFVTAASVAAAVYIDSDIDKPLSVQELIDCDHTFNKGCAGGNPVYGYQYSILNGLSGWNNYIYKEKDYQCALSDGVSKSYIKSYIMLQHNDQEIMRRYLSLGPLSVGVCATDASFLYYSGGVYSDDNCCKVQNHAMLLVGYGYDTNTGLDYWLVMNSWGSQWGESGYLRIKRTNTNELPSGTCGIALNPSIAVGGYFVRGGFNNTDDFLSDTDGYNSFRNKLVDTYEWIINHTLQILIVGCIIMLVLSILSLFYVLVNNYLDLFNRPRRRQYTAVVHTGRIELNPIHVPTYGAIRREAAQV